MHKFSAGDVVYQIGSTFHKRGTVVRVLYDTYTRAYCVVRFAEGAEQTFADYELAAVDDIRNYRKEMN